MIKRQELMEKGIKLFSQQGFYQTSVQEIAQAANISKGAFYKHFESKESLIIEILNQYKDELIRRVTALNHFEGMTDQEIFIKKIHNELEQWISNREFFTVLYRDLPPNKNKEVSQIIHHLKDAVNEIHKEALLQYYGKEIVPFLNDIIIVLQGILKEYVTTIFLQNKHVDLHHLASFILLIIDSIVQSLPKMEPVLGDQKQYISVDYLKEEIRNCLIKMEEKVDSHIIDEEKKDKLFTTISLLNDENELGWGNQFLAELYFTYLKQESSIEKDVQTVEQLIVKYVELSNKDGDV